MKGVTCGRGICPFGSECCMTCDEEGQLIESGQCESTLYGNPGCSLINCLLNVTTIIKMCDAYNQFLHIREYYLLLTHDELGLGRG